MLKYVNGAHLFAMCQLLISSFAICAFAYFALNSTGIAFLLSIAYCIFLNMFDLDKNLSAISIFPASKERTGFSLIHILLVFLAGIVLHVVGTFLSKVKASYK